MNELYPDDADLLALADEPQSGVEYIPTGLAPHYLEFRRMLNRILRNLAPLGLRVCKTAALAVGVKPGGYWLGGQAKSFPGTSEDLALANNEVNYVYLDEHNAAAVASASAGWPAGEHVKLASVTTAGGDFTPDDVIDFRGYSLLSGRAAPAGGFVDAASVDRKWLVRRTDGSATVPIIIAGQAAQSEAEYQALFDDSANVTGSNNFADGSYALLDNTSGAAKLGRTLPAAPRKITLWETQWQWGTGAAAPSVANVAYMECLDADGDAIISVEFAPTDHAAAVAYTQATITTNEDEVGADTSEFGSGAGVLTQYSVGGTANDYTTDEHSSGDRTSGDGQVDCPRAIILHGTSASAWNQTGPYLLDGSRLTSDYLRNVADLSVGEYDIIWDFGEGNEPLLTGMRFWTDAVAGAAQGTWKVQYSDDGVLEEQGVGVHWHDVTGGGFDFLNPTEQLAGTFDGASEYYQAITFTAPAAGHRYWRIIGVSGAAAAATSRNLLQAEFRIQSGTVTGAAAPFISGVRFDPATHKCNLVIGRPSATSDRGDGTWQAPFYQVAAADLDYSGEVVAIRFRVSDANAGGGKPRLYDWFFAENPVVMLADSIGTNIMQGVGRWDGTTKLAYLPVPIVQHGMSGEMFLTARSGGDPKVAAVQDSYAEQTYLQGFKRVMVGPIGTNDFGINHSSVGLIQTDTIAAWTAIAADLATRGLEQVILCTVPPRSAGALAARDAETIAEVDAVNAAIRGLCRTYGFDCYDLHGLLAADNAAATHDDYATGMSAGSDGIHPGTQYAHQVMAWALAQIVRDLEITAIGPSFALAFPTTDPAVYGRVWSDAGVLKVSAGA